MSANQEKNTETQGKKKDYVKPSFEKHKSATIISGSGCSEYSSKSSGNTYYH